jgi:hypothetical protein
MKSSEFYNLCDKIYQEELLPIMKGKGQAYSGLDDKLANFKRIAAKYRVSVFLIWAIYFNKHVDALDAWLRQEYNDTEPIEGRIDDLINYLFLLRGLIVDMQEVLK